MKNIKEKYQAQATTCPQPLLLQALELCNKADLQYKNSKNQRLLVEITLMQLCGMDETNESPSTEKKTFIVKSQPEKKTTINNPNSTTNFVSSEIKEELKPKTLPNEEKVLKSVVNLKEKSTRKRTISIDLNNLKMKKKKDQK